jgi:hypothetical protein
LVSAKLCRLPDPGCTRGEAAEIGDDFNGGVTIDAVAGCFIEALLLVLIPKWLCLLSLRVDRVFLGTVSPAEEDEEEQELLGIGVVLFEQLNRLVLVFAAFIEGDLGSKLFRFVVLGKFNLIGSTFMGGR